MGELERLLIRQLRWSDGIWNIFRFLVAGMTGFFLFVFFVSLLCRKFFGG